MNPAALPPRSLLLDDARPGGRTLLFQNPASWIVVHDPDGVPAALNEIDAAVQGGKWVAGSFAFELGFLLEPKLRSSFRSSPDPLIAVGIYDAPQSVDFPKVAGAATIRTSTPLWRADDYTAAFAKAREFIAAGDVYQINLTFPLVLDVEGDPFARLAAWRAMARAGHTAIQRQDDRDVFSFSPELFLHSSGDGRVRTRPMKGTAPRAPNAAGEPEARQALLEDPKQRAENLMIVDLLRNDLTRIAVPGSVSVSDLFTVETYPTLHTMTSGVEALMRDGLVPSDVLRALFPCGSVTGAPKVRAMELIAELEPTPRGVYCGAVGAFGPGLRMDLNVAIRTLVHEHGTSSLRMGVGGGVVFDSAADAEYRECLLKARFVTSEPFEILETLRWEPEAGAYLLGGHLERMAATAAYFGVRFEAAAAEAALAAHVAPFDAARRVRLLLSLDGELRVESAPLIEPFVSDGAAPLRIMIASTRLDAGDAFVRHKTTKRQVYDEALAEAKRAGADEAILLNRAGRVADGSFTSVFAQIGGVLVTPPASEGALEGVLKRSLTVTERPLSAGELLRAEAIYVGNSVRGLRRAVLI
jgi:para-aminobenzoate synthetase/4-amino-4-deoxychorismate lyase